MILLNKTDKSWLITWTSGLLVLLALVISIAFPSIVKALETPPAFRVVDVRSEQGQLVVEVQHFYPNGNHWFYQLYTWQGREAYKYPRVTNEAGELLLEDNTVAPYGEPNELGISSQYVGYSKIYFEEVEDLFPTVYKVIYIDNAYGNLQTAYFGIDSTREQVLQYQGQPDGESNLVWEYRNGPDWKYYDYPSLDETSILQIVSNNYKARLASNWTGDRGRTVLPTFNFNMKDQSGAKALVERFDYLAFSYVEEGIRGGEQKYDKIHTPKIFTLGGEEYTGDASILPSIQPYFEIIDLRTQDSKTYQLGNQSRTSVFQKDIHYQTDSGNWETSSLRFWKVTDEDLWIMNTHPNYTAVGTSSHISMVSPEGEVGARWYTPSTITYEGNTAWYEYDGIRWTYSLTGKGIKLTSESLSPRGPKEYPFVFLPLGSANPLRIDTSGNATTAPEYNFGDLDPDGAFFYEDEYAEFSGPQIVVPKAVIIGADGERYLGGDWEIVDDYTIKFAFDDNILPAQAFPYVIDPTTSWTLTQAEDDGTIYCNEGHSSWPLTSSNSGCAVNPYDSQNFSMNDNLGSPNYYYYTSLFRWDTSSLPDDALPISATFNPYIVQTTDTNDRNLVGEWYVHDGSMAYADDYSNARGNNALTYDITNIHQQVVNVFNLNDVSRSTIDVDGYTGLRVAVDGGAPPNGSSQNRVRFAYTDDSTKPDPILTVTYSYASLLSCQSSTATFYPNANVESTSVDGSQIMNAGGYAANPFSFFHDGAGYGADPSGTTNYIFLSSHSSSNNYVYMYRTHVLFDTTSLPDDAIITKADFKFVSTNVTDDFAQSLALVEGYPASNTNLVAADYANYGTVRMADDLDVSDVIADKITYNSMYLNSYGRAHIDPQGITKFGVRLSDDVDDNEPVWAASDNAAVYMASADEALAGERRPNLTVEYITPCAQLGGEGGGTTVSNSTTSTFYSETGNDVDGKANNNSTNQKWHQLVSDSTSDLAADTASPLSTIIATGPSTGNFQDLAVAFVLFDTVTLPDYGCESTGSDTYSTGDAGGTDGYVMYSKAGVMTFPEIMSGLDGGGTLAANDSASSGNYVHLDGSTTTDKYGTMRSIILMFDTSGIPSNAIVTSGTLSYQTDGGADSWSGSTQPTANSITAMDTTSDTAIAAGDYHFRGEGSQDKLASDIAWANLDLTGATFNNHKLNSKGVEHIDVDGVSKFAIRTNHDASGLEPPWSSGYYAYLQVELDEQNSGTTNDPKLYLEWALPCDGIHSATFNFVTTTNRAITYPNIFEGYISLVSSSPASDTAIVTADLDQRGSVRLADNIKIDDLVDDSTTYTTIGLNDIGIANLDDAGISKFALASSNLIDDINPTNKWEANKEELVEFLSTEGGVSTRPKLTVVHGDSSVAHIDGGDIVTGGKTIVLTLNGAHWASTLTTTQKQAIIDGLDGSHGAGAVNWNEAVRDNLATSTVVRTNNTTVTITLSAQAAYAPATTETITATINEGVTNPTVTFQPDSAGFDATLSHEATTTNYGTNTKLIVGDIGTLASYGSRAIIKFDISGGSFPADAVITSTELEMFAVGVDWRDASMPDACTYDMRRVLRDWVEGEVTFNNWSTGNAWSDPGGRITGNDFSATISASANIGAPGELGRIIWTSSIIGSGLNNDVENFIDGGYNNYGWALVSEECELLGNPVMTETDWASSDHGTAAYRPKLRVTYERPAGSNVEIASNPVFLIDPIPFDFTSFTPTMAANSGTLQMTITGVGLPTFALSGSAAVNLVKGVDTIYCTGDSDNDPAFTSLVVNCIVNGVATGDWDVYLNDGLGNDDTHSTKLTLYESWSSTVNGGSFSQSGSDYGVFAHDATPFFTVQAFDEVDKEWDSASSPPATIPAAAGQDAMFTSDKTRLVVGTAANANYLWAYVFDPATGVISGTPPNPTSVGSIGVNDFDIGTGDNIVVAATTDSAGVYMYDIDNAGAIAGFWTSTLSAPSSPPGAECTAVDINANATYVAVGCTTTPYLHVWAITNGGAGVPAWGTKVATVSDLPDGAINGVKFSPDGTQIAIAIDASPYIEVYEFNGGTVGDKASAPGTPPTGVAYDVDWLQENTTGVTNLAVAHAITPFVSVYSFTTDAAAPGTFNSKLDDPITTPTGTASTVGFHPNDDTIFVGHAASPYVTAYNFTGVSDDDYRVYRYMANFDTSYLPDDATGNISAATLSFYGDSVNGSGWQLLFEDGTAASEPLVVGDYDFNNYSTQLTASGHTPTTGWNDVTLNAAGIAAISTTGITQILIRHEDDIGTTAPAAVETMDIEVGDSGTFPESCLVSTPAALRSNSLYNLCNSPNVPVLRITYTSASAGPLASDADLSVVLTDADSPNADGTYNTQVFAKGPIVYLEVSTSPSTSTYEFGLNRTIADSANDWTFLDSTTGAPFPFMKNFKAYSDDGVTQTLWYELDSEPRAQMEDRAGSNDSSYMSLPNDSTTVTSTVGTPGAVGGISVSIGEGAGVPSIADDSADSSDIVISGTSDTSNSGLPLEGFFDYVEEAGGMPSGVLKLMFAMVVTILAGLVAFKSFQSVAATYIAMLMAIVAFTLGMNGIFEWWMLLTFGLTGGIFIFTRRAYV